MNYLALFTLLICTTSFEVSAARVGFDLDSNGAPDDPALFSIAPGDVFSAQLVGDFSDTSVIGGGFSLTFAPLMIEMTGLPEIDPMWNFASTTHPSTLTEINNGTVDVVFNTFPSVSPGIYPIASFEFTTAGNASGTSSLSLESLTDFPFSDDQGNLIDVEFDDGTVNVVPLPASFWLFAAPLLCFMQFQRFVRRE